MDMTIELEVIMESHWFLQSGIELYYQHRLSPEDELTDILFLAGIDALPNEILENKHLKVLILGLDRRHFENCELCDISLVSNLEYLETIRLSRTKVFDLSPLENLKFLRNLECARTKITSLQPLQNLRLLERLDVSLNLVEDLSPLQNLDSLVYLNCAATNVKELRSLSGLKSLKSLTVYSTPVTDLSALKGMNLVSINCSETAITDLNSLAELPSLKYIRCNNCSLEELSWELINSKSLQELYLFGSRVKNIPPEILSLNFFDNCLPSLRAHYRDISSSFMKMNSCKLMILGNGRVGKTQIARRLRGLTFELDAISTHGVSVSNVPVPNVSEARFYLWDFGGQDIYHGTHALFLRNQAVFVVAWCPENEIEEYHVHEGLIFRNYPLQYWLRYICEFSGGDCAVIVVQTQCDAPALQQLPPREISEILARFSFWKVLQYSAKTNSGRAALDEALSEAYQYIDQPFIGEGRYRVIEKLNYFQADSSKKSDGVQECRKLSYREYEILCAEAGNICDSKQLLFYLHNSGIVFYKDGMFDDQIILDQSWALDAIYALFNRDRCYRTLKNILNGRFDCDLIGQLLWDDLGYTKKEQELFLGMMASSGVCFPLIKDYFYYGASQGVQYLAPDLLPDCPPADFDDKWISTAVSEKVVVKYSISTSLLIRQWMAKVGSDAGLAGDYWRTGFLVPERNTSSRAKVEQFTTGDLKGEIHIETQGCLASELLRKLLKDLGDVSRTVGISPVETTQVDVSKNFILQEVVRVSDTLDYRELSSGMTEYYVSYAWNDDQPNKENHRKDSVMEFCKLAEARNIIVIRDKTALQFGDSITRFMNRLAHGHRIFIFLSDSYLKSVSCMYELTSIWQRVGHSEDVLIDKIRVYIMDGSSIWTIANRMKYASYWKNELECLQGVVEKFGIQNMGRNDLLKFHAMKYFAFSVADVLSILADRVQPLSWNDFLEYGFDCENS